MARALTRRVVAVSLLLALGSAGGAGAQTIGPDLLIPGTALPPQGALRLAAQISTRAAWSYFSVADGRSELSDSLGGSMTTVAGGIETLWAFSPHAALFVSWLPGGVFASSFSADEQRRATGFFPLHSGVWVKLSGDNGLWRGSAAAVSSGVALVTAIPMPWPDYQRELERLNQGLTYTPENSGVRAWGFGYLLEGEWCALRPPGLAGLSLWAAHDLLLFLPADYNSAGLREFEENRIWELLQETESVDTIWYRYQAGAYLAPRLRLHGASGALWRVGLPLSFRYRPEPVFDGDIAVKHTQEWQLDLGVQASVILPQTRRYWEFVFGYRAPLAGRNLRAEHQLSLAAVVDFTARTEALPPSFQRRSRLEPSLRPYPH